MNSITKLCELIEYYQHLYDISSSQSEANIVAEMIEDLKSLKDMLVVKTR